MSVLKRIEKAVDTSVALERPEVLIVNDGDMSELENYLAQLAARFGGNDKVNAVISVLPVYEDMPKNNKMRDSKKGEYLSAVHYANNKAQVLPFGFTENNLRVSFSLFEKVGRDEEDNDESGSDDTTAE